MSQTKTSFSYGMNRWDECGNNPVKRWAAVARIATTRLRFGGKHLQTWNAGNCGTLDKKKETVGRKPLYEFNIYRFEMSRTGFDDLTDTIESWGFWNQ